jgi:hypothetical protein
MVTLLPIYPNTIAIASTASGVTLSDLAAAFATVQATVTTSCENIVVVEAVLQQKQAATTSDASTAPVDLAAALATLQVHVTTTEVKAQQV